jgi:hypothetical protein
MSGRVACCWAWTGLGWAARGGGGRGEETVKKSQGYMYLDAGRDLPV